MTGVQKCALPICRPAMPIEHPLVFYPRYAWEVLSKHWAYLSTVARFYRVYRKVKASPDRRGYTDLAITPTGRDAEADLAMITETRGGTDAVAKRDRDEKLIKAAKARVEAAE